jgi:IS4 transposase
MATVDDSTLWEKILTGMIAIIGGVATWLARRVIQDREELIMLKGRVENLEKDRITQECVREVIESVLEKRDKVAEERRKEWDRRQSLEIKQAVHDEIEKLTPKIINEVRAATGKHKLPSGAGEIS